MGRSPHERARWEAAFAELDPLERAAFWRLEVQGEHPRHAGAALGLPAADAARLGAAARSRVRATLVSRHLAGETDERCALVCEQLDGLLSGRLARRVEAALADHLDGCGRCRRLCHELAHAPAELAAALEPRAPEGRTGRADPPNRPVLEVTVVRAHGPRPPRRVIAAAAAVVVLAAAALAGWVGVLRDLSPGGAGGELASPPIESGPAALPPPPTARASASVVPASGPVFSTPSIAAPEASAAAPAEAPVEPAPVVSPPAVSPPAVSPPPAPEDQPANAAPAVAPPPVRVVAAAPSTGAPSAAAPSTTAPPAPEASILAGPFEAGGSSSLVLEVRNPAEEALELVSVRLDPSSGALTPRGASVAACRASGESLVCHLGALAGGAVGRLELVLTGAAGLDRSGEAALDGLLTARRPGVLLEQRFGGRVRVGPASPLAALTPGVVASPATTP